MVFDGSKESCPNYNNGELNTDYQSWFNNKSKDPSFNNIDFQKTCFQICGRGSYVKNSECRPCPNNFYNSGDSNTVNPDYRSSSFVEMCDYRNDQAKEEGIPVWFKRQKEGNLKHENVDRINWSSASSQVTDTNSEAYKIQQYWKSNDKGLTNEEILRLIGNRTVGTLEYTLPEEYMRRQPIGGQITVDVFDFEKLRRDINDGRGSVVYCGDSNKPSWAECPNGKFGPNDIISEEVEDFITEILDENKENKEKNPGGVSGSATQLGNLLSGLQYDSAFEDCVNNKLNTIEDMDEDYETQERIAGYTSIKDFQNKDIHYLKRKLRKIINMKSRDVTQCMNLLNLGKSVCATGVADKTLMIGSLIFKVIGNNRIDIMRSDNDERYKINKLIDELGPLIPKAVKNIIKISKEYESRVCNVPTNTTLLLERLYMELYDKETKVTFDFTPNFDLNFNELANTTNFWHFIQKITVLVVMSVLLFMAANFVTAFISRTQVITKVNDG
ncbi:MAG: hypothetical protein CMK44_01140 [Porticoccus sp.]|nr:hypothetical protein [Porticoccus sp.]|tara:strand:- start:482 stop:1981 length:1500 start_codon:yes stop_codon:yes gene_type:complete